jgi:hypothetical protein
MRKLKMILLFGLLSSSCAGNNNRIFGTYKSICILHAYPAVTLNLKEDKTFIYHFPYVEEEITGEWATSGDTLVLQSKYFGQAYQKPLSPSYKYTDIPGKDLFLIRRKKLFELSSTEEAKKNCHLVKQKEN